MSNTNDNDPGVIYVDIPDKATIGEDDGAWTNLRTFPRTPEGRADAIAWIRENIGHCDEQGRICLLSNDLSETHG